MKSREGYTPIPHINIAPIYEYLNVHHGERNALISTAKVLRIQDPIIYTVVHTHTQAHACSFANVPFE